jgi:hypothetical protein
MGCSPWTGESASLRPDPRPDATLVGNIAADLSARPILSAFLGPGTLTMTECVSEPD